jgi:hypothetical protein
MRRPSRSSLLSLSLSVSLPLSPPLFLLVFLLSVYTVLSMLADGRVGREFKFNKMTTSMGFFLSTF